VIADSRRGRSLALAWRLYAAELRRGRRWSAPALLLPAVGKIAIFYVPPLLLGQLVARLAAGAHPDAGTVTPYVLGFAVAYFIGDALIRAGDFCLNRAAADGTARLYVDGLDALLSKDAAFFADSFAGALTKKVVSYASRYSELVNTLTFAVVANLVPLLFASVVLGRYDARLVLVLLGMIALTAAVVFPMIVRRQRMVDAREGTWAGVSGAVADVLGNIDAARTFAAQERESVAHRRRVREHRRLTLRSWDYSTLRIDVVVALAALVTNCLGLLLATQLGVAGLVVVFAYYLQSTQILFEFNQTYRLLETALTDAAQFAELLLDPSAVVDVADPEPLAPADSSVAFRDVHFAYAGAAPLFAGFALRVEAGERVGLVGRSGGGKTTLTRLLLRQMDVQAGAVLVGGQDVSRLAQADLRSQVAYVPQDPAMFHRSLYDNIAYGRPSASPEEVHAAAEAAHVLEFVAGLPEGLGTLVGERGVKLSGGQRQRVAVARAVLRDAPILVLDEATSALDSESEALVQEAVWRLMAGRTALVVAHRLSTVAQLDRLVVLDAGQVVETGTHEQLLAADGAYSRLWARQSGGFLLDPVRPDLSVP